MAGPKDLFKRALSKVSGASATPTTTNANWQDVPKPAAPAKPSDLREDSLIAQIEAEPDDAPAPAPPAVASTPAAAPPAVAAKTPAPAPAPATASAFASAGPAPAADDRARTARDAAAAMAARIAARRAGAAPTPGPAPGPATPDGRAQGIGPTTPAATAAPAPAPAPAPVAIASSPSSTPTPTPSPTPSALAGIAPTAAVRAAVPAFSAMPPIGAAERRGGVGATFVPAAGPIPFAHIGAFRWLMPMQAAAPKPIDAAPAVAKAPPPIANGASPVASPAPAPVATRPTATAPYEISDEELKGPSLDDAANDFLGNLSGVFGDLTPSKADAQRVAALVDPLEGATDSDGDGIIGLSDVLETDRDVEDEFSIDVEVEPTPKAATPASVSGPASVPAPAPSPAPAAAPAKPAAPAVAPNLPSPTLQSGEILRSTITALGSQVRERDDIARIVLQYASSRFARAALFVIKKEMLVGWEGGGGAMSRSAVRGIMVPLTNPSIFKTVFETKVLYCGGVPRTTVNDIFFSALGEPRPERVIVVPFVLKDKVACVLYADGGDVDDENPASIGELYQLGRAVSGAFENLILRTKRGA